MAHDAPTMAPSGAATPMPSTPRASTPINGLLGGGQVQQQQPTFLAGSRALDALAKLITSCETLFHPSVRTLSHLAFHRLASQGADLVCSAYVLSGGVEQNTSQSSVTTATLIWALAAVFVKRWKSEEKE